MSYNHRWKAMLFKTKGGGQRGQSKVKLSMQRVYRKLGFSLSPLSTAAFPIPHHRPALTLIAPNWPAFDPSTVSPYRPARRAPGAVSRGIRTRIVGARPAFATRQKPRVARPRKVFVFKLGRPPKTPVRNICF